ncbi:MAG: SEC-C metal-binding domain-containing protein [Phycisphaerae bacterium]
MSSDRFQERERRRKEHSSQLPGEDDQPLPPPVEPIKSEGKVERNDPCPCGSGKKFKKCCGKPGGEA